MTKTLEKRIEELEKKVFGKPKKYQPVICNGLMWSKTAPKEMNWDEAKKYAENLSEGGYKDWRLPTVSELQNVFDYVKGKVKIEFKPASNYWSGTTISYITNYAWRVNLTYGYTYNVAKTNIGSSVRCVRRLRKKKEVTDENNSLCLHR